MKTYIRLLLITAMLVPVVSCHKKERNKSEEIPQIEVAEAMTDSVVLHKTYPGYLSADNSAEVVGKVNGQILTQNYRAGAYVNRGDVLFTIDPTLYRDAVERGRASLASAISSRDYAKDHYEAVKKALEAEAVSKMEVLSAQSAYEQAEANIRDCKAALHTAETNLGYCTVVAPLSGYITDSYVSAGNYISGAAEPVKLAKIYDNSFFNAVFEIEDAQYEKMVGRTSGMASPLYSAIPLQFREKMGHDYTADLTYQAPAVDKSTGTVMLKGKVKNIDNELKDGMYVTVSLRYGKMPKAILVKDASIGTDQLGNYLYLVNDSNKVVYAPIEVGEIFRDSLRVVTKGIKAGDRYVTKALLTVRAGEAVKPVTAGD